MYYYINKITVFDIEFSGRISENNIGKIPCEQ